MSIKKETKQNLLRNEKDEEVFITKKVSLGKDDDRAREQETQDSLSVEAPEGRGSGSIPSREDVDVNKPPEQISEEVDRPQDEEKQTRGNAPACDSKDIIEESTGKASHTHSNLSPSESSSQLVNHGEQPTSVVHHLCPTVSSAKGDIPSPLLRSARRELMCMNSSHVLTLNEDTAADGTSQPPPNSQLQQLAAAESDSEDFHDEHETDSDDERETDSDDCMVGSEGNEDRNVVVYKKAIRSCRTTPSQGGDERHPLSSSDVCKEEVQIDNEAANNDEYEVTFDSWSTEIHANNDAHRIITQSNDEDQGHKIINMYCESVCLKSVQNDDINEKYYDSVHLDWVDTIEEVQLENNDIILYPVIAEYPNQDEVALPNIAQHNLLGIFQENQAVPSENFPNLGQLQGYENAEAGGPVLGHVDVNQAVVLIEEAPIGDEAAPMILPAVPEAAVPDEDGPIAAADAGPIAAAHAGPIAAAHAGPIAAAHAGPIAAAHAGPIAAAHAGPIVGGHVGPIAAFFLAPPRLYLEQVQVHPGEGSGQHNDCDNDHG